MRINSNLKTMTVEELLGQKKTMHVTAFRHFLHDELPHDLRRIADAHNAPERCAAPALDADDGGGGGGGGDYRDGRDGPAGL